MEWEWSLLAFWNHTINPPSNGRKIAFWGTPQHKYYLWDNSMEVSEYKEVVYLFTNSGVKWLKTPPQSGCQCTIANLIMNRVLIGRWKWPLIMSGVAELQSISMTYMKRRSCGEMETKAAHERAVHFIWTQVQLYARHMPVKWGYRCPLICLSTFLSYKLINIQLKLIPSCSMNVQ